MMVVMVVMMMVIMMVVVVMMMMVTTTFIRLHEFPNDRWNVLPIPAILAIAIVILRQLSIARAMACGVRSRQTSGRIGNRLQQFREGTGARDPARNWRGGHRSTRR
jgi:hypothetical protein